MKVVLKMMKMMKMLDVSRLRQLGVFSCLAMALLLSTGCDNGYDDDENVSIHVDASEDILFDVFDRNPVLTTYSVDLLIIDELSSHVVERLRMDDGSNFEDIEIELDRRIGFYLEANGFYEGRILLTDILLTDEDDRVDISFGRDVTDRITVQVNGYEVAVFDTCGCLIVIG